MCIGLPNWLNWLVNPLAPVSYAAKKVGGETAAAVVDPVAYAGKYAAGETDAQKQQRQKEKEAAQRAAFNRHDGEV